MNRMTSSLAKYQNKKRKNRRKITLKRMDKISLWKQVRKESSALLPQWPEWPGSDPLYSMRRVHCMRLFGTLSGPAMEYAQDQIEPLRHFAGLKLDRLPSETTILNPSAFPGTPSPWQGAVQRVGKTLGDKRPDVA